MKDTEIEAYQNILVHFLSSFPPFQRVSLLYLPIQNQRKMSQIMFTFVTSQF